MATRQYEEYLKLIKQSEFFSALNDNEIDELVNISLLKKFDLNEIVISESGEGHYFYVILKGAAKIVKGDPDGEHHTLLILSEGDCFGEMAILLREPRSATVIAGKDCHVFEVEGDHLDRLSVDIREKIYRQFAINLARRLQLNSLGK